MREMHATVHLVENRGRKSLQKLNPRAQRLTEIKFAVHGTRGDGRDLLSDTRGRAEFVDDLLVDQSGIHVHHQQSRR